MRCFRHILLTCSLAIFFLIIVLFFLRPIFPDAAQTCVVYTPHESFQHFAAQLPTDRFQTLWARLYLRLFADSHQLHAGEYCFSKYDSSYTLLTKLRHGHVAHYPFTIQPGIRFMTLSKGLRESNLFLTASIPDDQQILNQLLDLCQRTQCIVKPPARSTQNAGHQLDGLFLPETYDVDRDSQASQILLRAFIALQHFLTIAYPQRDAVLPYNTPYTVLIVASIIEKESGDSMDRRRIAGVIVNRLERHMPLQTDPVLLFGLQQKTLHHRDLSRPSPYNVYRHRGLPPTPICFPSRDAILAALHPTYSDDLYYVAKKDGTHQFSVTLKEHDQAIKKYLLTDH